MRRITMWITATIAATALMFAYQANASGTTGKSEDGGGAPPAATAPAVPGAAATPTPSGSSTSTDGKAGGTTDQHVDKPGESK